jgi:hypothetical protein
MRIRMVVGEKDNVAPPGRPAPTWKSRLFIEKGGRMRSH